MTAPFWQSAGEAALPCARQASVTEPKPGLSQPLSRNTGLGTSAHHPAWTTRIAARVEPNGALSRGLIGRGRAARAGAVRRRCVRRAPRAAARIAAQAAAPPSRALRVARDGHKPAALERRSLCGPKRSGSSGRPMGCPHEVARRCPVTDFAHVASAVVKVVLTPRCRPPYLLTAEVASSRDARRHP
jgi:hypothetical protein